MLIQLVHGRVLLETSAQVMDALLAMEETVVDSSAARIPNVRKLRTEGCLAVAHFDSLQESTELSTAGDECPVVLGVDGVGMSDVAVLPGVAEEWPADVVQNGQVCSVVMGALEAC